MDSDLPWPRGFAPHDADLHDALGILRLHPIRVDVLRETDDAAEFAAEAFLAVIVRLLLDLDLPLARNREQVLLHGDFETLRIDAGGEQVNVDPLGGLTDVDRRKAAAGERADA